ncbi:MerR family transcriptional regulator [Hoyosella rhizosphaerae]|uniref:HTH merR-type domain-containing protein n=1 Tax=Hoyosella rhizosphaerae TaxID=1755582 RepID=A0A916U432_9ACTN|nr:MerR family transcriptional regulator [Hoyosella rhizosphaerae]MBN4926607.1 MerR family transcriptional regulator [Hoyosella rhizosphaerae]GGC57949.1 hypothetical protein GCM10011410_08010 [Hoyosella rhizosphaerae]
MTSNNPFDSRRGVYAISVAAELSGVGVQMLRHYERVGLLTPRRTSGGTRRYSDEDLTVLARITDLISDGVNLAGVAYILALEERNRQLEAKLAQMKRQLGQ